MKVLLLNGSPDEAGCTYTALREVADSLEAAGVGADILHVGGSASSGCTGCRGCRSTGRCVISDTVNDVLDMVSEYDGFVFGSPVYYASANGAFTAFLDRLFYAGGASFAFKPGACVVSARRAGTTAALDQLNKYLTISRMPVVSSRYWNMVHGNSPDEVKRDLEGMQVMRALGANMAWLLRCIEAGRAAGVEPPETEPQIRTNFVQDK